MQDDVLHRCTRVMDGDVMRDNERVLDKRTGKVILAATLAFVRATPRCTKKSPGSDCKNGETDGTAPS